jgi:hypothetical protein
MTPRHPLSELYSMKSKLAAPHPAVHWRCGNMRCKTIAAVNGGSQRWSFRLEDASLRSPSLCVRVRGLELLTKRLFTGGVVAAAAPDARSSCALTAVSDHSGLSANRAGVLNAQSWRLIIVWLEVRVLPAPPRSPAQTGISRFSANRPEQAAICPRILSLQSAD